MKETGQDAGGMEKEWFTLITEQFLNSELGIYSNLNQNRSFPKHKY